MDTLEKIDKLVKKYRKLREHNEKTFAYRLSKYSFYARTEWLEERDNCDKFIKDLESIKKHCDGNFKSERFGIFEKEFRGLQI